MILTLSSKDIIDENYKDIVTIDEVISHVLKADIDAEASLNENHPINNLNKDQWVISSP